MFKYVGVKFLCQKHMLTLPSVFVSRCVLLQMMLEAVQEVHELVLLYVEASHDKIRINMHQ